MNVDNFYKISIYLSMVSVIIPVAYYLVNIKSQYPRYLHFIGILCLACGLVDVLIFILVYYMKVGAAVAAIYNLLFILQFCLLSAFFYEIGFKKEARSILNSIIILLHVLVIGVLGYYFASDASRYQGIIYTIGNGVFLFHSIYYFNRLIWIQGTDRLSLIPPVWINLGILVYFSVGTVVFILRDKTVVELPIETEKFVWIFHNACNIIKNMLFAKGLELGTIDYKQKPFSFTALVSKIDSLLAVINRQRDIIEASVSTSTIRHHPTGPVFEANCKKYNISDRQKDVIKLVITGKTDEEVGNILFISKGTVGTHKFHVYQKTGVSNVPELILKLCFEHP